jgi:putative addiction module killer protein
MTLTVVEYVREDGSNPYRSWFDGLDPQAAAKVTTAILRLEMGNTSRVKWIGAIGEYRIDWGLGYRVYLARDGNALIILRRRHENAATGRHTTRGGAIRRVQGPKSRRQIQKQEVNDMALTRDFKQTVAERVQRDPAFAKALLDEAATLFLNGEPQTARLILRDLVNATVGFEGLAAATGRPAKSLHRMLSENGNPSMDNLAAILRAVREKLGVDLQARAVEAA